MSDIATRVPQIIADQLSVPVGSIEPASTLISLGADSLDVVELIMRFEDEFDIEIKDEDVESLTTVAQVIEYLEQLVVEQHPK